MVKDPSRQPNPSLPFTRKEFYDLAVACRAYATELADFDPRRVNLKQCHRFNAWLAHLKRFDRLGPRLASLQPARPVARWQVAILTGVLAGVLMLALAGRVERLALLFVLNSAILLVLMLYLAPERIVGTTVEEIEGRVLRVVRTLESMLAEDDQQFSQAAYFQVKANLEAAALELRQQLDLAHRD